MGWSNFYSASGNPGHGETLDVRVNATPAGRGLSVILNAGYSYAGGKYSSFFSFNRAFGQGGFYGLSPDAVTNWVNYNNTPPFSGNLDDYGSARIDIPSGSFLSGFRVDAIYVIQDPGSGAFLLRTQVLEWDT